MDEERRNEIEEELNFLNQKREMSHLEDNEFERLDYLKSKLELEGE